MYKKLLKLITIVTFASMAQTSDPAEGIWKIQ